MLILREEKLVRPHIQLKEVMSDTNGTTDKAEINPETWTPYQFKIGRCIGSSFDVHERAFLAGDAVHTHEPCWVGKLEDADDLGKHFMGCLVLNPSA
ncbi:hypothetical protein VUR80DRAFT_373 [Thermomyces stellatus]